VCNSSTGADAAIPEASATASGVITTGTQIFAGAKTFGTQIGGSISGNAATVTDGVYTSRTLTLTQSTGITVTNTGSAQDLSANRSWTITNSAPHVATDISWTAGTTSGPICNSSTGSDSAIPVAAAGASGVVTTTTQSMDGAKTFTTSVTSPSFNSTSARIMKENIKPFVEDAETLINEIKVVSFNFKADETKENKIGFIADDTNEIFAGKEHDKFDHMNTISVLIKAVQELSEKNKQLVSRIETLEKEKI